MKKIYMAAIAAILSAGMAFSSIAATIPAEPQEQQTEVENQQASPAEDDSSAEVTTPHTASPSNADVSYGGGSGSHKTIVPHSPEGGKWVKHGSDYSYYYDNGILALDRWFELEWNGTIHWYYFDISGNMVTGWFKDNLGNWYYLNPTNIGVYGSMVTGWNFIDGKWYYFNEKGDGFKGTLFCNTTTPDGYQVDSNGAWIQ